MLLQLKYLVALIAISVGLSMLTGLTYAQDAGSNLDALSLEDLLNVQVVTASKNAESISDAPGIVTTISAKEIEQFGATSLLEVLDRLAGTYVPGSTAFPQSVVSMRSDMSTVYNNHVLLLLNGRPFRESLRGGVYSALYTTFPVETIERLEVVRGPGSVLYGSNAYSGVINIITKEAGEAAFTVSGGYGSFNARSFAVQGGVTSGDLAVSGGVHVRKEDSGAAGGSFNLGEDLYGGSLTATYKGLRLGAFLGANDGGGYMTEGLKAGHWITDLGYERALMPWWDASVNVTLNQTWSSWSFEDESRDVLVEMTHYVQPFRNANLVFGGLANHLTGQSTMQMPGVGEFEAIAPYAETWWSGYAQLDVRPARQLKLIAGGQFNKVEGVDLAFVPRLGAIFYATDALGAKLLYGQAFRSAFATERLINAPGIGVGNPDLQPETVTTLDAQVFYNASRLQLAATYFNSKQDNLINEALKFAGDTPFVTYDNDGTLSLQGLELEAKLQPADRLYVTGSFVYQTTRDGQDREGTTLVPTTMAKVGVSYDARRGVTVGLFESYANAPHPTQEFNPQVQVLYPDAQAYHYLTANLRLDLTKLMNLHRFPTMQLDFYATNLLGAEVYVSDVFTLANAYPRYTGRSFYGTFRVML